jgi:RecB family exonuclease
MNDRPILSASSITEYLKCPQRYYLSHVLRLRGTQSLARAIGQAVHSGVEALWKSPVRPLDALRATFARELESVPTEEIAADPEALADAETMLATYRREVFPVFHPTYVEEPFLVETEGVLLSGTIDAADEDVHDTKTRRGKTINGRRPASFHPDEYRLQLTIYSLGYKVLAGTWPGRLILDVLNRRGGYKSYEVQPDYGELREVLALVNHGIMQGNYEPSGALSGACYYCPFQTICDYSTTREVSV